MVQRKPVGAEYRELGRVILTQPAKAEVLLEMASALAESERTGRNETVYHTRGVSHVRAVRVTTAATSHTC